MRCTKDGAPGEQLTISYGDNADNDRLLRLYGFAVLGKGRDLCTLACMFSLDLRGGSFCLRCIYTRGVFTRRPIAFVFFDGRPIILVYS